ncbi:MAG TPA: hypothetical protein PKN48_00185 [Bacteroidales bacterium]|nr:hypothetical protein [Bacteroidales bacterium]
MFVKYKIIDSHGFDSWEFEEFDYDDIKIVEQEIRERHYDNEQFRGVELYEIPSGNVPYMILYNKLRTSSIRAKHERERVSFFKKLLKDCKIMCPSCKSKRVTYSYTGKYDCLECNQEF